ncbi:MAG: hypothetical protein SNG27_09700 [Rikenellaceae bacterium]
MSLLLIIFGLFSGCFLAILVGLIGSRRTIGFGWAFVLSLLFTPLVGLICALLTDPLPGYSNQKMGCIGITLSIIGALLLIPLTMFIIALITTLFIA